MVSIYWNGLSIHGTVTQSGDGYTEPRSIDVSVDLIEVDSWEEFADFLAEVDLEETTTPDKAVEKYSGDVNRQLRAAHYG